MTRRSKACRSLPSAIVVVLSLLFALSAVLVLDAARRPPPPAPPSSLDVASFGSLDVSKAKARGEERAPSSSSIMSFVQFAHAATADGESTETAAAGEDEEAESVNQDSGSTESTDVDSDVEGQEEQEEEEEEEEETQEEEQQQEQEDESNPDNLQPVDDDEDDAYIAPDALDAAILGKEKTVKSNESSGNDEQPAEGEAKEKEQEDADEDEEEEEIDAAIAAGITQTTPPYVLVGGEALLPTDSEYAELMETRSVDKFRYIDYEEFTALTKARRATSSSSSPSSSSSSSSSKKKKKKKGKGKTSSSRKSSASAGGGRTLQERLASFRKDVVALKALACGNASAPLLWDLLRQEQQRQEDEEEQHGGETGLIDSIEGSFRLSDDIFLNGEAELRAAASEAMKSTTSMVRLLDELGKVRKGKDQSAINAVAHIDEQSFAYKMKKELAAATECLTAQASAQQGLIRSFLAVQPELLAAATRRRNEILRDAGIDPTKDQRSTEDGIGIRGYKERKAARRAAKAHEQDAKLLEALQRKGLGWLKRDRLPDRNAVFALARFNGKAREGKLLGLTVRELTNVIVYVILLPFQLIILIRAHVLPRLLGTKRFPYVSDMYRTLNAPARVTSVFSLLRKDAARGNKHAALRRYMLWLNVSLFVSLCVLYGFDGMLRSSLRFVNSDLYYRINTSIIFTISHVLQSTIQKILFFLVFVAISGTQVLSMLMLKAI